MRIYPRGESSGSRGGHLNGLDAPTAGTSPSQRDLKQRRLSRNSVYHGAITVYDIAPQLYVDDINCGASSTAPWSHDGCRELGCRAVIRQMPGSELGGRGNLVGACLAGGQG